MFDISWHSALIVFSLIGFAGFIDAIAGGGGLLTIPTYLSIGVPSHLVLGTNKLVNSIGTGLSVSRLVYHYKINRQFLIYALGGCLTGGCLGAMLSHYLDKQKMVYLLIMLVPALLVIKFSSSKKSISSEIKTLIISRQKLFRGAIVGLLIGGYDGFFGPGTGTFLYFGLVYYVLMSVKIASVYARIMNFVANVAALSYFLSINAIAWSIVVFALPGALIGYWLGSQVIVKGSDKWIKYTVTIVLIVLLVKSVYDVAQ